MRLLVWLGDLFNARAYRAFTCWYLYTCGKCGHDRRKHCEVLYHCAIWWECAAYGCRCEHTPEEQD